MFLMGSVVKYTEIVVLLDYLKLLASLFPQEKMWLDDANSVKCFHVCVSAWACTCMYMRKYMFVKKRDKEIRGKETKHWETVAY